MVGLHEKAIVEALYPDGEFDIFDIGDSLSIDALLPGFRIAVKDVFEE